MFYNLKSQKVQEALYLFHDLEINPCFDFSSKIRLAENFIKNEEKLYPRFRTGDGASNIDDRITVARSFIDKMKKQKEELDQSIVAETEIDKRKLKVL